MAGNYGSTLQDMLYNQTKDFNTGLDGSYTGLGDQMTYQAQNTGLARFAQAGSPLNVNGSTFNNYNDYAYMSDADFNKFADKQLGTDPATSMDLGIGDYLNIAKTGLAALSYFDTKKQNAANIKNMAFNRDLAQKEADATAAYRTSYMG